MEIKIVYDNEALPGFKKGWGFSCLIELNKTKLLFDTGDGTEFLINLQNLGVNPTDIEHVIISHPHYDHIDGLKHLVPYSSNFTLYFPSFFPIKLKMALMSQFKTSEIFGFTQIFENVYLDIAKNHLWEQFCILNIAQGLLVITGCAHPGLDVILNRASNHDKPLFGVIGGFHGFSQLELLKNLKFIAPCHCTSKKAAILQRFPNIAHKCASGITFQL